MNPLYLKSKGLVGKLTGIVSTLLKSVGPQGWGFLSTRMPTAGAKIKDV